MWYKQSVKERLDLMKLYKKAYPKFSYQESVQHFNDGGEVKSYTGPTYQDAQDLTNSRINQQNAMSRSVGSQAIMQHQGDWYDPNAKKPLPASGRADYVPIELAAMPAARGLGKLGNFTADMITGTFRNPNNLENVLKQDASRTISHIPTNTNTNVKNSYNYIDAFIRNKQVSSKSQQNIVDNIPFRDKARLVNEPGDLIRRQGNTQGIHFENGKMYKLNSGTDKKSIHFTTTGESVKSHNQGSWDSKNTSTITPFNDFGMLNGQPRALATNDTYWWNPRQFEFPKTTKTFTGDMEHAANLRNSGYPVEFNKDVYKIQKEMKSLESKYKNSKEINLNKLEDNPRYKELIKQNADLHNNWIISQNPQKVNNLTKNVDLGPDMENRHLFPSDIRSARSTHDTPYIHSETPEGGQWGSSYSSKTTRMFDSSPTALSARNENLSHVDKIQLQNRIHNADPETLKYTLDNLSKQTSLKGDELFYKQMIEQKLKTGKGIYKYQNGGIVK